MAIKPNGPGYHGSFGQKDLGVTAAGRLRSLPALQRGQPELQLVDASPEGTRDEVTAIVAVGSAEPSGHIPFTPQLEEGRCGYAGIRCPGRIAF
jgi:hypothetical protein